MKIRVLLIAVAYVLLVALLFHRHDGAVLYPLDDTYIHIALGRTLAMVGVWGVQPGEWAAASSSPLFSLILASLWFVWPSRLDFTFAPLVVNLAAGLGLIYTMRRSIAAVWLLLLAAPLVPLTLLGMEHVLHIWLAVLLLTQGIDALRHTPPPYARLGLLAALAVACRYESLVLVATLVLFALVGLRWKLAAVLAISAIVPVLVFGLMWHLHGGWFLPNSLLVKAPVPHGSFRGLAHYFIWKFKWNFRDKGLTSAITLTAMMLLTLVLVLFRSRRPGDAGVLMGLAVLVACMAQMLLGQVGWLYRYEAWLLVIGGSACLTLSRKPIVMAALALILLPLAVMDMRDTWMAPTDRLYEHVAPAEFVSRFWPGHTVVVNDIGIMSYMTDARLLDLVGLASNQPIRLRREKRYTAASIATWARNQGADIAILQACWPAVAAITPPAWHLVEVWRIPHNAVFNNYTIGFYGVTPIAVTDLRSDLARFSAPDAVTRVQVTSDASPVTVASALHCQD